MTLAATKMITITALATGMLATAPAQLASHSLAPDTPHARAVVTTSVVWALGGTPTPNSLAGPVSVAIVSSSRSPIINETSFASTISEPRTSSSRIATSTVPMSYAGLFRPATFSATAVHFEPRRIGTQALGLSAPTTQANLVDPILPFIALYISDGTAAHPDAGR